MEWIDNKLYEVKLFFKRLKKTIDFLPLVWKSYDFDYSYSINLFKHNLKYQEKHFLGRAYRSDALNQASRIRTAIDLMDKVYNEGYTQETIENFERLYGPSEWTWLETEDDNYAGLGPLKWAKAINEEHNEQINELYHEMIKDSYRKEERAHKILWRFIEHNIKNWWD